MNSDEEADESVETGSQAEPNFVYEADFHIGGHPGLNHNSIYVGPLHPWLTSIERSDGMLHPFGLSEDAFEGRLAPVKAWLDGGGHVDSYTETLGSTLLVSVASARHITARHVELMRYLISLGADVNRLDWQGEWSPLRMCVTAQSGALDAVELLLAAGATINARSGKGDSPKTALCDAIDFLGDEGHYGGDRYAIVWALLRAGASFDSCWGAMPIESRLLQVLRARPNLVSDHFFGMIRDIIRSVRQAGSYKRWSMQEHYDILTLRGLANRDYITSTDPKLNSLVALPNEVLCHVLGYWKAIMPAFYDINPSFPRPSTA